MADASLADNLQAFSGTFFSPIRSFVPNGNGRALVSRECRLLGRLAISQGYNCWGS